MAATIEEVKFGLAAEADIRAAAAEAPSPAAARLKRLIRLMDLVFPPGLDAYLLEGSVVAQDGLDAGDGGGAAGVGRLAPHAVDVAQRVVGLRHLEGGDGAPQVPHGLGVR